jgi:hypothetical protein
MEDIRRKWRKEGILIQGQGQGQCRKRELLKSELVT